MKLGGGKRNEARRPILGILINKKIIYCPKWLVAMDTHSMEPYSLTV